ncbi:MAG TPA: GNAT family N-acetyltransferase [Ancylobacter sp.]
MLTLRLRPATDADTDWLTELFLSTMQPAITAARGAWDRQREETQFRSQLRLADTRVIRLDQEEVGFITVAPISPSCTEVHTLCVKTDCQGVGIATSVLRELMSAASDGGALELSVLKTNGRAHALYERLGFEVTRTSTHHIRMRWVLRRSSENAR